MGKRRRKKRYEGLARDEMREGTAPLVAAGLTEGLTAEEADEALPKNLDAAGVEVIRHMREGPKTGRVPTPRFVVRDDVNSDMVTTFSDGRHFRDTERIFPPDVLSAIRQGMICLRCLEPQPWSFADEHLPGCEGVSLHGAHYMKDRQILDLAMEMEGEVHLGPSKPISEYLLEQDLRHEERKFRARLADDRIERGRR